MNDQPRPVFFRRLLAGILDLVLVTGLCGFLTVFVSPASVLFSGQGISKFISLNSPILQKTKIGASLDRLKEINLSPQNWEEISRVADKTFRNNLEPKLRDPIAWMQLKNLGLDDLAGTFFRDLRSQTSLGESQLTQLAKTTNQVLDLFLKNENGLEYLGDLLAFLGVFALPILWGILGYYSLEALFGAGLGKFLVGLRIGTQDGHRGNLLITIPRYLGKFFGWGLVGVGFLLNLVWLVLTGVLVAALLFVSKIGILWGRRQPFYDRLTRTSVFSSRALFDS